MIEVVSSSAELSPCGRYRYQLSRTLKTGKGTCVFIMLNPSTADHAVNDQTIRQCLGFTEHWGNNRLVVVNLFAWRATKPRDMFTAIDPVGPDGDGWITRAVDGSNKAVCAWGSHGTHQGRGDSVLAMLRDLGYRMSHMGLTKNGQPRHPLYLARDTKLQHYPHEVYGR